MEVVSSLCETIKSTVHLVSNENTISPPQLNTRQCQLLAKQASDALPVLEELRNKFHRQELIEDGHKVAHNWTLAVSELHRVLKDSEILITDCCCDGQWLQVAIKQGNLRETFAKLLYDIQWHMSVLCSANNDGSDGVLDSSACEGKLESSQDLMLSASAEQDRKSLQELLRTSHVCDSEICKQSCLAMKLLEKLDAEKGSDSSKNLSRSQSPIFLWVPWQDLKRGRSIGGNSYVEVLEATWMGQKYAVKIFQNSASYHELFRRDIAVMAGLDHPQVIRIVCCSESKRNLGIVMERMYKSLRKLLHDLRDSNEGTQTVGGASLIPIIHSVDLMLQTAEGVRYLHSKGCVHRDLTADNILVQFADPQRIIDSSNYVNRSDYVYFSADNVSPFIAKVADFGLKRMKHASIMNVTLLGGTTAWMAPELFGKEDTDVLEPRFDHFKVDAYSFGIVCYEILTGETPFHDMRPPNVRMREFKARVEGGERPALPAGIPKGLSLLIQRCWDTNSQLRPDFPTICTELRYIKSLLLRGTVLFKALTPEVSTPFRISSGHTGVEGSFSNLSVVPSAMAQPLVTDYPSRTEGFREAGSARAMEKLESHLELAEHSSEAVQNMSNLQKFNKEQCGYLADKLEVVIRCARLFLEVLRAKHDGALSSVDSSRPSEIFKLLVALAKQIEDFAQECCKDKWIRAAMSLTIVSDYVSSLGFNLELCKLAFCEDHAATGCLTLFEICNISEAEAQVVEKKALADVRTLIEIVTLELNSLRGSERDLASYLLQRLLKVEPSTPTDSVDGTLLSRLFAWVVPAEQVGRGASATVYKAMWLGTSVAKKTFHGSNNPDFLKEVKILSKLHHPSITSMFCCEKNERNCSIIMELMDGDLYQVMQRRCGHGDSAPFPTLEAVDIMLQIGEGVNYLHSQGIVHRDLKSMNILVRAVKMNDEDTGYMHAKVTDFGVSKTSRNSTTNSKLTSNVGTPRWMPPEVMQSTTTGNGLILLSNELPKYPFKCDTYSFGMVCYEILTGHVPFSNVVLPNVIRRMVLENCERPHLPSSCPSKLKALIEKCWAQEPRERPTFVEICQELKHLKYLLMTGRAGTRAWGGV